MVTIYTLAYNEEPLIQFMIDHYRERFPGCRIVVYDNMSTDNTAKIALDHDCEIVPFDTNNQYQEGRQVAIRNSCWKTARTDWVIVCDMDELLDINEADLRKEEELRVSIIRTETYDMINMRDNLDVAGMRYGVRSEAPGKCCLFNKKRITDMNYGPGSHACRPEGEVAYSANGYKLYHYNSINEALTIEKFRVRAARFSSENLKNGWGIHYFMTPDEIRREYAAERAKAIKIR